MQPGTISLNYSVKDIHMKNCNLTHYTVETFWLLQLYFGHLSCMPDVCVTHYKTSKGCFLFESKLKCS